MVIVKFGYRKPNISKSFKARTTGNLNRKLRRAINPLYGRKGFGAIKNPQHTLYNQIYHKTTKSSINTSHHLPHQKTDKRFKQNYDQQQDFPTMKEIERSSKYVENHFEMRPQPKPKSDYEPGINSGCGCLLALFLTSIGIMKLSVGIFLMVICTAFFIFARLNSK